MTIEERLDHYLPERPEGACWIWTGTTTQSGYPVLTIDGRQVRAHRLAYMTWVGLIPEGLTIDHVRARGCVSQLCCNPAHLEPVTAGENAMRGTGACAARAAQETCVNGHPFDLERPLHNGRFGRDCSICRRERGRKYEATHRRRRRAGTL